jgi:hypothetical protein
VSYRSSNETQACDWSTLLWPLLAAILSSDTRLQTKHCVLSHASSLCTLKQHCRTLTLADKLRRPLQYSPSRTFGLLPPPPQYHRTVIAKAPRCRIETARSTKVTGCGMDDQVSILIRTELFSRLRLDRFWSPHSLIQADDTLAWLCRVWIMGLRSSVFLTSRYNFWLWYMQINYIKIWKR